MKVSLGISSLRAYGLSDELLDDIASVKATGLTFAPEAGTQRMRDVEPALVRRFVVALRAPLLDYHHQAREIGLLCEGCTANGRDRACSDDVGMTHACKD
jgi:hypothetical protein